MKVVIAGNYREYRDWLRENNLCERDARYIDCNEKLMGLELAAEDVIKTGQWWLSEVDETLLKTRIRKPNAPAPTV